MRTPPNRIHIEYITGAPSLESRSNQSQHIGQVDHPIAVLSRQNSCLPISRQNIRSQQVLGGMTKRQTTTKNQNHHTSPQITTRIWDIGSETRDDAGKPLQTTTRIREKIVSLSIFWLNLAKARRHVHFHLCSLHDFYI